MRRIFSSVRVNCTVCGSPTDGRYRRGDKYYCSADYDKEFETQKNEKKKREITEYKKIFQ